MFILVFNIGSTKPDREVHITTATGKHSNANYADSVKLIIQELKTTKEELKTIKFKKKQSWVRN
jgi:hypothetical protein